MTDNGLAGRPDQLRTLHTYVPASTDQSGNTLAWQRRRREEEFDSPETIEALAAALAIAGPRSGAAGRRRALLRRLLAGAAPDLVFNFAEGRGIGRSREARIPAVLEMLGIPYTGSDPLTLACAR